MRADSGDGAALDQRHAVGQRKGGWAMHDQKAGDALQHAGESLFDRGLGMDVDGRKRVVEDEQRRSTEHGSRQGKPLPLTSG